MIVFLFKTGRTFLPVKLFPGPGLLRKQEKKDIDYASRQYRFTSSKIIHS